MGILSRLRSIAVKGTATTLNITQGIVVEAKSFAEDVNKESQIQRIQVIEHTEEEEPLPTKSSMKDFVKHVRAYKAVDEA